MTDGYQRTQLGQCVCVCVGCVCVCVCVCVCIYIYIAKFKGAVGPAPLDSPLSMFKLTNIYHMEIITDKIDKCYAMLTSS